MIDLAEQYFNGFNRPVFANVGDAVFANALGNLTFAPTPPIDPGPANAESAALVGNASAGRSLSADVEGKLSRQQAPTRMLLTDHFIQGNSAAKTQGSGLGLLKWQDTGTWTMVDDLSPNTLAGVQLLSNEGAPAELFLGGRCLLLSEMRFFTWVLGGEGFSYNSADLVVGLWDGFDGGADQEGAYFSVTQAGSNYLTTTRTLGVSTTKDTGIPRTALYVRLAIVKTQSGYDFYLNEALVGTHGEGENISNSFVDVGCRLASTVSSKTARTHGFQYLATRGAAFNNV